MVRLILISLLTLAAFATGTYGADSSTAEGKKLTPAEAAKARMRAEAKKAAPQPTASTPVTGKQVDAPKATTTETEPTSARKDAAKKKDEPAPPPTVLPKVEVRNSRITELDQKIAKQEKDIEREKQNTRSTEADRALNAPKVSRIFSLFGGESSEHRAGIAQERVSLMEAEKDILEAMKTARTKEEKAELQKQLDELKAYRRELEKSLR